DLPPRLQLKLENLQVSGSFKARGVFNNLLQLDPRQRERGVITASGGNHGLALAYAAYRLGLPATVYLPVSASADREARIAGRRGGDAPERRGRPGGAAAGGTHDRRYTGAARGCR